MIKIKIFYIIISVLFALSYGCAENRQIRENKNIFRSDIPAHLTNQTNMTMELFTTNNELWATFYNGSEKPYLLNTLMAFSHRFFMTSLILTIKDTNGNYHGMHVIVDYKKFFKFRLIESKSKIDVRISSLSGLLGMFNIVTNTKYFIMAEYLNRWILEKEGYYLMPDPAIVKYDNTLTNEKTIFSFNFNLPPEIDNYLNYEPFTNYLSTECIEVKIP